ncbi:putative transmembrane protein ZNF593OS [Clarias gariepinus]
MIIRLGRLTPGYFHLLQRQVAGDVQVQPQHRSLNQIAMMLAIMGLSLSYYSAKQMTEKVQRDPVP